jgi:hypothetical protein
MAITTERVGIGAGPNESGSNVLFNLSVSWSAIVAGGLVSLGVWFLLHTLGMGVGLIAVDPDYASSLRAVGIGTGIWSLVAPLIGLFVGGMVTARLSGSLTRLSAVIHGAVLWSIATIVSLMVMVALVGAVLDGVSLIASADMRGQPSITSEEAADASGRVMLGIGLVMLLGLLSTILGAWLVENRNVKRVGRQVTPTMPTPAAHGAV